MSTDHPPGLCTVPGCGPCAQARTTHAYEQAVNPPPNPDACPTCGHESTDGEPAVRITESG